MLGLFSAVTLVVGEMIGSGIFLKPAAVDSTIGGYVGLILALWVVCGLVNLCGALALAELVAMFPHEGGTYVFLREAYGRLWSFLWCWTEFWVIRTGAIAALAAYGAPFGRADRCRCSIGRIDPAHIALVRKGVAIGLIALLGGINVAGTLWGGRVQNVMTTIKVAFIVLSGRAAVVGAAQQQCRLAISLARLARSGFAACGSGRHWPRSCGRTTAGET